MISLHSDQHITVSWVWITFEFVFAFENHITVDLCLFCFIHHPTTLIILFDHSVFAHFWSINTTNLKTNILMLEPSREYFPLCIVWSPIPCLTWLIPVVGHLGIVTSEGTVNDFAGPYFIHKSKSRTAFGPIAKYYRINPTSDIRVTKDDQGQTKQVEKWDESIECSSQVYEGMVHMLLWNNCHSHVAMVLNKLNFRGLTHWNTFFLICFMCLFSRYVSWKRMFLTWIPFLCLAGIIVFLSFIVRVK